MHDSRDPAGADVQLSVTVPDRRESGVPLFLRFLLTGGIAAFVNLASRYLLSGVLVFEFAVLLAYMIGMVTAFILFRFFVFGVSERGVSSEVYRFFVVNLVALSLVWIVSVGLARIVFPAVGFTWYAEDIAHLIGVSVPVISSFIGHSKYTFRRQ